MVGNVRAALHAVCCLLQIPIVSWLSSSALKGQDHEEVLANPYYLVCPTYDMHGLRTAKQHRQEGSEAFETARLAVAELRLAWAKATHERCVYRFALRRFLESFRMSILANRLGADSVVAKLDGDVFAGVVVVGREALLQLQDEVRFEVGMDGINGLQTWLGGELSPP